jgi:hypothetical protein
MQCASIRCWACGANQPLRPHWEQLGFQNRRFSKNPCQTFVIFPTPGSQTKQGRIAMQNIKNNQKQSENHNTSFIKMHESQESQMSQVAKGVPFGG